MTKLWFKARSYGWGWTPISVEGWIVVFVFVVLILAGTAAWVYQVSQGADPHVAVTLFTVWNVLLCGALMAICLATGEAPRWRWGP
jgi:hypothetical protein